jgi:hypothetical protein
MPAIYFDNLPYRQCIPGQWLRVWNGFVYHHGILSGFWLNPATNCWVILVTHSIPGYGVVCTGLDYFSDGRFVEIVRQPSSPEHQASILATAAANVGKSWTVFQNCEHFSSHCYYHKPESIQLQQAGTVAGFVIAAGLLLSSARRA